MSFEALKKCMTIKELITFAILKAYQMQMHQGDITDVTKYTFEQNKMFLDYIGDEINALNYDEKERKAQDLQR